MPTREWKLWVPQVRTRFIAKRCGDERSVINEQVLDMEQSSEAIGQDIWTKSCRDYDETDCPCDVCAKWRKQREDSWWSGQHYHDDDYDHFYPDDYDDVDYYFGWNYDRHYEIDYALKEYEEYEKRGCRTPEDSIRLDNARDEKLRWISGDDVVPAQEEPSKLKHFRQGRDGEWIEVK